MIRLNAEEPKILVIGSSSIDLVLNTEEFPTAGKTVMAVRQEFFFGGKGANQAVAAARLGASVYFISSVGIDPQGQQVMRNLLDEGVNVGFVTESENEPTGSAYVATSGGENSIVVVPAANSDLKIDAVERAERLFETADLVLLQLEIPMEVVEYSVRKAKANGKKVGLYAAPAVRLSEEIVSQVDFIVAKKNDLEMIFANANTEELMKKYPNKLFVRDNENTTSFFDGAEIKNYANHNTSTNKMGMGDAFTAGFSVAICHQNSIDDSVIFGNFISDKVSEKRGSQTSLPYLKDIIS